MRDRRPRPGGDGRPLLGREPRADRCRIARRVKAAGGAHPARRRLQAAHLPLQLPGARARGLEILAGAREETGLPHRHRGDRHRRRSTWSPSTPTCCRSAPATCRTTRLLQARRPRAASRCCSSAACRRRSTSCCSPPSTSCDQGNHDVILCERGIRTFATTPATPSTSRPSRRSSASRHLPIIVDPSHGTGKRDKVLPLARAAVAAGADGLHRRGPRPARPGALRRRPGHPPRGVRPPDGGGRAGSPRCSSAACPSTPSAAGLSRGVSGRYEPAAPYPASSCSRTAASSRARRSRPAPASARWCSTPR